MNLNKREALAGLGKARIHIEAMQGPMQPDKYGSLGLKIALEVLEELHKLITNLKLPEEDTK
jgi:hypothetical protein